MSVKWLRIAVVLVLIGVLTQIVTLISLTPPTFLAFVIVGVPCMLGGVLLYVVHVFKQLKKKDAL
ncbi:MAG: hypothetical protein IT385_11650 [Deltaproteobacteria bacterium]|nr:hypothetical protein [Deltaproteobacteria bacterium]